MWSIVGKVSDFNSNLKRATWFSCNHNDFGTVQYINMKITLTVNELKKRETKLWNCMGIECEITWWIHRLIRTLKPHCLGRSKPEIYDGEGL